MTRSSVEDQAAPSELNPDLAELRDAPSLTALDMGKGVRRPVAKNWGIGFIR